MQCLKSVSKIIGLECKLACFAINPAGEWVNFTYTNKDAGLKDRRYMCHFRKLSTKIQITLFRTICQCRQTEPLPANGMVLSPVTDRRWILHTCIHFFLHQTESNKYLFIARQSC